MEVNTDNCVPPAFEKWIIYGLNSLTQNCIVIKKIKSKQTNKQTTPKTTPSPPPPPPPEKPIPNPKLCNFDIFSKKCFRSHGAGMDALEKEC